MVRERWRERERAPLERGRAWLERRREGESIVRERERERDPERERALLERGRAKEREGERTREGLKEQ